MRKAPEPCRIPSKGSFIFVHPHPVRFVFLFLLLFASVILLGIRIPFSYSSGPGTLSLQVLIEYRGAFEREIERILTVPLENALSEIRGVEEIFSHRSPGRAGYTSFFRKVPTWKRHTWKPGKQWIDCSSSFPPQSSVP